jgi:hypothetical protein
MRTSDDTARPTFPNETPTIESGDESITDAQRSYL